MISSLDRRLALGVCASFALESIAFALFAAGVLPPLALALHVAATALTRQTARLRSGSTRAELDVVTLLAFFVPVLGPLTAWTAPREAGAPDPVDAHEAFEEGRAYPKRRFQTLTGQRVDDLRSRLDVESYESVLRSGDSAARANLVRILGDRGAPEDLGMIRRILEDPEDELRIQAYMVLRDRHDAHVRTIGELAEASELTGDPGLTLALARAHLDFAKSGALDPGLEPFEIDRALDTAAGLVDGPMRDGALCVVLEAHGRRGDWEEASDAFSKLGTGTAITAEALETIARIAFRARDRVALGHVGQMMQRVGVPVPAWVGTALGARRDEVIGVR